MVSDERLPANIQTAGRINGWFPMNDFQQIFKLRAEETLVFNDGKVVVESERVFPQPAKRFITVEMNPHQGPAGLGRWPVAMPFSRTKEKRFTGFDAIVMGAGLDLTPAVNQVRETKFRQGPPVLPFEEEERGVRLRVRLARRDLFPTGMSEIQRLMKQRFIHRQRVSEGVGQAHFFGLLNQNMANSSISSNAAGAKVVAIAIAPIPAFGIQCRYTLNELPT
jgi:hypothetical protein